MLKLLRLRLITKLLLCCIILPLLLFLGLIAVFAVRYWKAPDIPPANFALPNASATLIVSGLEQNISTFSQTRLYQVIERILKDKVIRSQISGLLTSWGLPSLGKLEDPRFRRRMIHSISERELLRLCGKQLMISIGSEERPQVSWAIKLPFVEFLIFQGLRYLPGLIGAQKIGEVLSLGEKGVYLRLYGKTLVGTTRLAFLEAKDTVRGIPVSLSSDPPVRFMIDLNTRTYLGERIREMFGSLALSGLFHFLDIDRIRRVSGRVSFTDRSIKLNLSIRVPDSTPLEYTVKLLQGSVSSSRVLVSM
jgi:hypothetical protein